MEDVRVRVTHPTGEDLDQDLSFLQLGHRQFLDFKWFALSRKNSGFVRLG